MNEHEKKATELVEWFIDEEFVDLVTGNDMILPITIALRNHANDFESRLEKLEAFYEAIKSEMLKDTVHRDAAVRALKELPKVDPDWYK